MNIQILEVSGEIYITNNDHIGESDWFIRGGDWFIRGNEIHKCFRVHKTDIEFLTPIDSVYCGSNTYWNKEYCKKIILTTNKDLIKDGVQTIDNEFLEYLKQNKNCENVKLDLVAVNDFGSEITVGGYGFDKFVYKVIEPKVSLNSDHVFEEADFTTLENELIEEPNYNMKQEIIDEMERLKVETKPETIDLDVYAKGVQDGAKLMQEQRYSEEDMIEFAQIAILQYKFGYTNIEQIEYLKETLENFKKK